LRYGGPTLSLRHDMSAKEIVHPVIGDGLDKPVLEIFTEAWCLQIGAELIVDGHDIGLRLVLQRCCACASLVLELDSTSSGRDWRLCDMLVELLDEVVGTLR
jgi:hypothetical protein